MSKHSTRDQIVEAADELFYSQGFEVTSFADIAGAVQISRGNFYYHFKSKDDILDAVIDRRIAKTRELLDRWEVDGDTPETRIGCFILILITNQSKIMAHGCPVGTLASELTKLSHNAQPRANELFTLFNDWLTGQFRALGRKNDAEELALHLVARSQGVAVLANAFKDENFVRREVDAMTDWVRTHIQTAN
ncbi:TetR/AcrR family transcriptional regulator [Roseibium polysiphoniae]|uniref:TetR/AcrR family transcriptional regulator n=1 Tax=Roseibium polysiphoniae TaxID=2571221 RepID=UPI0025968EDC|nr:TetR/AcrR family transcriptional regulator [uncultured Roseibium sp.]